VVSSGFGFYKVLEKLGIERRIYTQGKSKSILDPFLPEKKDDVEILKNVQKDIYENFKSLVLSRRTNIKKKNHAEIFSGSFWSSKQAKELGLIDEIGDFHSVIREKFGKKIAIKKINSEKSWLKSLLRSSIGFAMDKFLSSLEEQTVRSRYDL
jgi:ClpP class serine protease